MRSHPAQPVEFLMGVVPMRSHPANLAKTFDGPPTLERSGSEHRRAVTSLIPMVGI